MTAAVPSSPRCRWKAFSLARQPFHDRAGFLEERGDPYLSYLTSLDRLRDELERLNDVEEKRRA